MPRRPRPYKNTPYKTPYAKKAVYRYPTVPRTRGVYAKGEMKYFDSSRAGVTIPASAAWASTVLDPTTLNTLVCPSQGSAINQRIGREIKLVKLKIRGVIQVPAQATASTADNATFIRFILVQDTQTNATQMTGAQLIGSGTTTVDSFQNLDNTGRFRVLKDKIMPFNNANLAGSPTTGDVIQSGILRHFKFTYKPKYPISIRFNAVNGGTIADIVDNSFHIVCNSLSSALGSTLSYQVRACYKE